MVDFPFQDPISMITPLPLKFHDVLNKNSPSASLTHPSTLSAILIVFLSFNDILNPSIDI